MKFWTTLFVFFGVLVAAWAVRAEQTPQKEVNFLYEAPTLEKLSQLYWALSKLDLKNDQNIDNYLMINECDIYKDYAHNEFEWQKVRNAGRNFINDNKSKFPLRFEVMQPLKLGEYDINAQKFNIMPDYQIKGIRRFEVLADNYSQSLCGEDPNKNGRNIEGYPRGLLVELSRPVTLTSLPLDSITAKSYIEEKMKPFKALRGDLQNERNLYDLRDAYLVMKVKFFSYRQETRVPQGPMLAEVLGILEGIDIYADKRKTQLLYTEDYRRSKKERKVKGDLKKDLPPSPMLLESSIPAKPTAPTQPLQ